MFPALLPVHHHRPGHSDDPTSGDGPVAHGPRRGARHGQLGRHVQEVLADLAVLAAEDRLVEGELRIRVVELVATSQQAKPPSRASLVRERLFEGIRPVRALLAEIGKLPWQAEEGHPVVIALNQLLKLYADRVRELPVAISAPRLGGVWSAAITGRIETKPCGPWK